MSSNNGSSKYGDVQRKRKNTKADKKITKSKRLPDQSDEEEKSLSDSTKFSKGRKQVKFAYDENA